MNKKELQSTVRAEIMRLLNESHPADKRGSDYTFTARALTGHSSPMLEVLVEVGTMALAYKEKYGKQEPMDRFTVDALTSLVDAVDNMGSLTFTDVEHLYDRNFVFVKVVQYIRSLIR